MIPVAIFLTALCFQEPQQDETQRDDSIISQLSPEWAGEFINGRLYVLGEEQLRKELEILPSQVKEINDRLKTAKEEWKELFEKLNKEAEEQPQDVARIRQEMQSGSENYRRALESAMDDVLLPTQKKELDRVIIWYLLKKQRIQRDRGRGLPGGESKQPPFRSVLQSDLVEEILNIDNAQKQAIDKRSKELQEEYREELAELQKKYEQKLHSELTRKQKRRLKEVIGEPPSFWWQ